MLTVKEYLKAAGLDVPFNEIKLVKHVDRKPFYSIHDLVENGDFDFFQAEQGIIKKPFHNCQALVSFVSLNGKLAEFIGVYYVNGFKKYNIKDIQASKKILPGVTSDYTNSIKYNLIEDKTFRDLRRRLLVQWKGARNWHQTKDLDIYEILPLVEVLPFKGYQDVFLTHDELRHIINNQRAHKDWKAALESNAGIYRIVDMSTGAIYIGSAYGNEGIWGRWATYAANGHGNNKLLKNLDVKNFRWSIIRTISRSVAKNEIIRMESMEKLKHGSRVHGLNDN